MKVLNFPICEIIETPLTLHRWFVPRKRSRSSILSRMANLSVFSSLVFDRRLQRGVHQPSLKVCAACFVDKSLSIGCQAAVKRVVIEISTNVTTMSRGATINSSSFILDSFVARNRNGTSGTNVFEYFCTISNNPREFFPRSFALRGMFLSFLCCLY